MALPTPPISRRFVRDAALFATAFCGIVIFGLAVLFWPALTGYDDLAFAVLSLPALAVLATPLPVRRMAWHNLANILALETPVRIDRPWVIDGDTIDDLASGVRYRLANIDAPETGDDAKCFNERMRGEQAKRVAMQYVRESRSVSVRRTCRVDKYGRRVAFVLVDGRDLGDILVERGLARPWLGHRRKWCGPRGGLAAISKTGAYRHACAACKNWR